MADLHLWFFLVLLVFFTLLPVAIPSCFTLLDLSAVPASKKKYKHELVCYTDSFSKSLYRSEVSSNHNLAEVKHVTPNPVISR